MMGRHHEIRMQQYQNMLREAEQYRLARELGFIESGTFRSLAAKLQAWLSQLTSREIASSDEAFISNTRIGS
jgi:L-amino acid N-acyltransferase YncA